MALPTIEQAGFQEPAASQGYDYRPLKRTTPIQRGWDVYALQTGFFDLGYALPKYGTDGYLGDETAVVIWRFQRDYGLKQDGIAGILTQRAIAAQIAANAEFAHNTTPLLLFGMVEKECGFQLGNFTPRYTSGKRDLGPTQRNLPWTTENCRKAFNTGTAIYFLAGDPERGMRPRKNKYYAILTPDRKTHMLAWEYAAGSWNAPAWADSAAQGRGERAELRAYIERVTAYVTEWIP